MATSGRRRVRDLLDREERQRLRALGWDVWRTESKRPSRIPRRDRLDPEAATEAAFVDLEVAE